MTKTPRTCDICNSEPATVVLAVMSTTAGWSLAEAADSARDGGTVRCDGCWKYSYPNRDDFGDRVLVALPL